MGSEWKKSLPSRGKGKCKGIEVFGGEGRMAGHSGKWAKVAQDEVGE